MDLLDDLHQRWTMSKIKDTHLASDRRPHLERVVIRAAHYAVSTELQTGDDMVIMAFQHLQIEENRRREKQN